MHGDCFRAESGVRSLGRRRDAQGRRFGGRFHHDLLSRSPVVDGENALGHNRGGSKTVELEKGTCIKAGCAGTIRAGNANNRTTMNVKECRVDRIVEQ